MGKVLGGGSLDCQISFRGGFTMAEKDEERKNLGPLIAGGGVGIVIGILSALGLSRPVEAASPEEKQAYLISRL